MTYSSEKIGFNLSRLIQTEITDLNYRISDDQNHPNRLRGLKDRVLDGPAELDVFGQNRFQAVIAGIHFNESLRRDFFFGASRIRKLSAAMDKLDKAEGATAWILTTCYYSAFFAGLELLRTTGTFISYFDSSEIETVVQRAKHVAQRPEVGTYEGLATFDTIAGEVRIEFTKTATSHHQFVWSKLNPLIARAIKRAGASDPFSQNLAAIVGEAWPSPSATRNFWNYRDASLFVEAGEKLGVEFRKLMRDRVAAMNWAAKRKLVLHEQSQASSVALVRAVIMNVFDAIGEKVLPPKLLHLTT